MKKYACLITLAWFLCGCSRFQSAATTSGAGSADEAIARPSAYCTARDAAITDQLRQSIVADPSMSVNARNIIIHTDNGLVSLKGAVNGWEEERRILEKTAELRGIKGVDDELDTHAAQTDGGDFR